MLESDLEVLPFFATSGRGRSSGSLWDSSYRSYVWTSTLAWAPISHIALGKTERQNKETCSGPARVVEVL